jgi:hypothetical protein
MSRSVAQPSPASAPGATTSISVGAVKLALAKVFRPVIRLAIQAGLKYGDLDRIVREVVFEEGCALLTEVEKNNTSRISTITGLHRKEVAQRLASGENNVHPNTTTERLSTASRVLFRWIHVAQRNKRYELIPTHNESPRAISFSRLAKEVVSDVHYRSLLDELIRLGFAHESTGHVRLLTHAFTPTGKSDDQVALLAQNVEAMLRTSVDNVLAKKPPQLEYSIAMRHVSAADAGRLADLARTCWQRTYRALYDAIVDTPEVPTESGFESFVFRAGAYVNIEEHAAASQDTGEQNHN